MCDSPKTYYNKPGDIEIRYFLLLYNYFMVIKLSKYTTNQIRLFNI